MNYAAPDVTNLDLSACDKEPIRTPGSIQPHGFLVALAQNPQGSAEQHGPRVVQISDNVAAHVGKAVDALLGQPLAAVVGNAAAEQLLQEMAVSVLSQQPSFLGTICTENGSCFDVLVHAHDGLSILEFEAVMRRAPVDFRRLYPLVSNFMSRLNDADSVKEMSLLAAREVRKVTSFGRVLVYRFDDDGHGHVVAECRDDSYHSYLHQRFPNTDIPRQARELYLSNRIRLIRDANYTPARLVPERNPITGAPNDLAFAALRSVSPVHLQYMRNMGTLASMSVSLIVKGKLWGLISCHDADPCFVPFDARAACEQLGQILALRIESREDADEYQYRLELRRIMVAMLAGLTQGPDLIDNMSAVSPELLRFAKASGAAIVYEDRLARYGDAPAEDDIRALVAWLGSNAHGDLFYTDNLSRLNPAAQHMVRNASGVLALPISRIHNHYLIWFRPELILTIDWAGNPHLKALPGPAPGQLTPRMSFESWRETIHGTSAPWRSGEIEMALEFRTALLGLVLERAEQMAELAEELGRANKELEAFSYSVSHDLRAPLRHIVGFTDLLIEFEGEGGSEKRQRFLKNIKDSAHLAGKLVDDLLSFSQMGRASLRPLDINTRELFLACKEKLVHEIGERRIEWQIGDLPQICVDPTFLQLAVYNLLSNAVKYTGGRDQAVIRISAEQNDTETIFHVADNGIGFSMDYVHKLFGVFQRLHRMEDFQGTGIGLANVRRIIERHGGRVWAQGVPEQGATFSFAIPKQLHLN